MTTRHDSVHSCEGVVQPVPAQSSKKKRNKKRKDVRARGA